MFGEEGEKKKEQMMASYSTKQDRFWERFLGILKVLLASFFTFFFS